MRRRAPSLQTVQGGRWGAVLRQGGGPFPPAAARAVRHQELGARPAPADHVAHARRQRRTREDDLEARHRRPLRLGPVELVLLVLTLALSLALTLSFTFTLTLTFALTRTITATVTIPVTLTLTLTLTLTFTLTRTIAVTVTVTVTLR